VPADAKQEPKVDSAPAPLPLTAPALDAPPPPLETSPLGLPPVSSAPPAAAAAPKDDATALPAPKADAGPGDPGNSSAIDKPAAERGLVVAAGMPIEPAPTTVAANVIPASTRATAPGPSGSRSDPQLVRTALERPDPEREKRRVLGSGAGGPVARVGDEIITFHEFKLALREDLKRVPQLQAELRTMPDQREANRYRDLFARQTLDNLIDRSLLAQEAKRHIKDAKKIEEFNQDADRVFHDDQVVPLLRKYSVDSDYKLKERLADEGRSLDAMRLSFRQNYMAESYMYSKLRDRVKVDLPEMLRYYNVHKELHEFDLPAQTTWREVVVEVANHQSREEARRKAESLRVRLKGGEDFAKLARAESEGPASARNQGGLMETSPGSYAVAGVNEALRGLPIGNLSDVVEGPSSFHVVKVERRRPAGPASFEDVQHKIKPILQNERLQAERNAFLQKLRKTALIQVYI
jgi:peptidyl-prolyl cis-trans isomerase SurA